MIVIGSSYTSCILNIFSFLIEIYFPNFVAEIFLSFRLSHSNCSSEDDAWYHDVCSIVFFLKLMNNLLLTILWRHGRRACWICLHTWLHLWFFFIQCRRVLLWTAYAYAKAMVVGLMYLDILFPTVYLWFFILFCCLYRADDQFMFFVNFLKLWKMILELCST